MSTREVPPGCQEIPGIILEIEGAVRQWITQDGRLTAHWEQRGVWATEAEAQVVLDQVFVDGKPEARP